MENMDKELAVPNCVLIFQPKIPQMSRVISAQNVCPSPKVWKKALWVSLVRGYNPNLVNTKHIYKILIDIRYLPVISIWKSYLTLEEADDDADEALWPDWWLQVGPCWCCPCWCWWWFKKKRINYFFTFPKTCFHFQNVVPQGFVSVFFLFPKNTIINKNL